LPVRRGRRIRITGNLVGTPATNTALLAFGTLSASLFGTIGASLLLIRPLIRANGTGNTTSTSSSSSSSSSAISAARWPLSEIHPVLRFP
jgi:hypothetical protein